MMETLERVSQILVITINKEDVVLQDILEAFGKYERGDQ